MNTKDKVDNLQRVVIDQQSTMKSIVEAIGKIQMNQNNLNNRLLAVEKWGEELAEANNNLLARINVLELRQDPAKHNKVTP